MQTASESLPAAGKSPVRLRGPAAPLPAQDRWAGTGRGGSPWQTLFEVHAECKLVKWV